MGLLTLLEVFLGLFFVYMLFAMLASALNEGVAAVLSSRADWLRRGMLGLLSENPKHSGSADSSDAVDKLYRHPMIRALEQPATVLTFLPGYRVNYIPAHSLLMALLSLGKGKANGGEPREIPQSIADARKALDQLPASSPIRFHLQEWIDRPGATLRSVELEFSKWFEGFEQQVSNWYRQRTHFMLMLISLFLAIGLNIDTVQIVRTLSVDPDVREAMVQKVISAIEANEGQTWPENLTDSGGVDGAAAVAVANPSPAADQAQVNTDFSETLNSTFLLRDELAAGGLPLGWAHVRWIDCDVTGSERFWGFAFSLIGWMLSAIAFTLGAPFWFDLLKNLASMRSIGHAPLSNLSALGTTNRSTP